MIDSTDYFSPAKCYARWRRKYGVVEAKKAVAVVEKLIDERGEPEHWWVMSSLWIPVYFHCREKALAIIELDSQESENQVRPSIDRNP